MAVHEKITAILMTGHPRLGAKSILSYDVACMIAVTFHRQVNNKFINFDMN